MNNVMKQICVLTFNNPDIIKQILTPVYIGKSKEDITDDNFFYALWDTGAMVSCITDQVIEKYKLTPTGKTEVLGINLKTSKETDTYSIDFMFGNGYGFNDIRVLRVEKQDRFDVIIGMDIISKGDFAISNSNGTSFSFRVPSMGTANFLNENYDEDPDQEK